MRPIKLGDSTGYVFIGNVVAYHNGAVLTCDSAIQYNVNKIECFENVLINKDSTYVYGDRVLYDGITNTAEVFSPLIKMIDGDATLYTYYFKYNTLDNIGEYFGGGTISQREMLLESERGYYYGDTRDAVCVGNVELRDSTYQIRSDSLGFNMDTEIATFYLKTYIWNDKGEILSADSGWYDTAADHYHFMSDAYVLSADQEMWAEDIDFHSDTEDVILRRDIQIFDKGHDVLAFGDYGRYWGQTGDALLTENPSVINFSQGADSLYMRADSIFLYVIDSTSVYSADYIGNKKAEEEQDSGEELIKPNGGEQTVAHNETTDNNVSETSVSDAVADNKNAEMQSEVAEVQGQENGIIAEGLESSEVSDDGNDSEIIQDETTATETFTDTPAAKPTRKELREARKRERQARREARRLARQGGLKTSVEPVADTVAEGEQVETVAPEDDTTESDTRMDDADVTSDTNENAEETTVQEEEQERVVVGYRNVKIYRSDMQAVCDSIVAFSRDTTAHLFIDPVMWNGGNQITSDVAVIYAKDEALDKAVFTGGDAHGNPVMCSELDEEHYNQISGKEIVALFRDNEMYRTDINGNAKTLYYMQDEKTKAFQGFLDMKCSDMTFFISGQEVEEIVFRTDLEYILYPMDMIPESQEQRLENFVWEIDRRPFKRDVFNRKVKPSQRREYEELPLPQFPLTESIDRYRLELIEEGIWRDRDEELSLDAQETVRRMQMQVWPGNLNKSGSGMR